MKWRKYDVSYLWRWSPTARMWMHVRPVFPEEDRDDLRRWYRKYFPESVYRVLPRRPSTPPKGKHRPKP